MRSSSGPSAATSSASEITWVGSRRSMPTILSRSIQSALSSRLAERCTAALGAGEAVYGVVGEGGGDVGVRAVAEQPQRDVHADLRAAAGQQRAASGEVG